MWEIAAYALIAIGSLVSTILTNKANKEQIKQNQDWQESMVDKQNEYNTPENQVERAEAAGINPIAAVMGNGSTFGSTPSASPNSVNNIPMLDPMASLSANALSLLGGYKASAEGKTANSLREYQIQLAKDQSAQYQANIVKLGVDTKGQMIANDYAAALNEVALAQGKANVDLSFAQIKKCNKEYDTLAYNLTDVLPQQVKESISRTNLNVWEQDKVVAEIERVYAETENIQADTALKEKQTELTEAQTDTQGVYQKNLVAEAENTRSQTKSLDQQIQLYLDTYDDMVAQMAASAKISTKQARWFVIHQIFGLGKQQAINTATGAAVAGSAIKAAARTAAPVVVGGF